MCQSSIEVLFLLLFCMCMCVCYLDGILHARAFLYAAFADGVGSHSDVLLALIRLAELRCVSVQLLQGAQESHFSDFQKGNKTRHAATVS